jgi:Phage protein (N4 Gp49/phage Sf6 gene 66) family
MPHPKVTQESILEKIEAVDYMTQDNTTICIIRMVNGFKVIGHSTPASPANYDSEVGKRYAYDNAFKQIYQEYLAHG